jgi:hypothetical protein
VEHAGLVRDVERRRDLPHDLDRPRNRKPARPREALGQILALHELEDDVRGLAGRGRHRAEVVHGDDARVHDARGCERLLEEAVEDVGVVLVRGVEDLDRDGTVEHGVSRAEHEAERALAEAVDEDVTADLATRCDDGRALCLRDRYDLTLWSGCTTNGFDG